MCHFFLAQALHDHTVFAEGEGCCGRMFQAIEPVTNCDQFSFFFRRKPEGEIHREAVRVSFDGLVQGLCGDAVYFSQICIDNYAMPPDGRIRREMSTSLRVATMCWNAVSNPRS